MIKEFSKAEIGKFGEDYCAKYLKRKKKCRIIAQNATIGHLEADIIAYDKDHIIFVEVKTRSINKHNFSRPSAAVDKSKRTNLLNFAYAFIKTLPQKIKEKSPRIDVCEILVEEGKKLKVCEFNYIENAITR